MTKLFNKQRLKKLDKEKYEIVQSVKYITFISKKAHFNSISNYKTFLPSGGSHDYQQFCKRLICANNNMNETMNDLICLINITTATR